MGWDVQGYYKNPGEHHSTWHVDCSGDSIEEIEAHSGYNPLSEKDSTFGELYYGNTGLEIFRGYSTVKDYEQTKRILAQFTGLPVYAHKWNVQAKTFHSSNMAFLVLEHTLLFYDQTETNQMLIRSALQDLKSRLEYAGSISFADIALINQQLAEQ